ncbi:uncharacterized protein N7529_009458 [Penicillium soppii]|uniref:uncharacterized protein n=1 Tax=Penicillium soppii TaxID=69789 RepID=UPI0025480EE3|nr:uncharacterized protein N7529_009458 [Penicillium soppii]KAJ5855514.1 hypothetical protein N7529_009458 [Penicillium soppii]
MNRDESHNDVSESSPLLRDRLEVAIQEKRLFWQKHWIKLLLCAFSFIMMLGDNLQPAALTQILETVICDDYYRVHPLPTGPSAQHCKIQPVQKELALVRGFQQLVPLFPGLLCTVPYGLLADRIGRKRVLVLTGAGLLAALSWTMAVCYWRIVSIRWVLLSGAFLFVGGGDAVLSSIVHIMVTETTAPGEWAQVFLYLHAADVISGFFGPAISAPLMEKGHPWAVLMLAAVVLFSGTFLLTRFIPESLHLKKQDLSPGNTHLGPGSPEALPQDTLLGHTRSSTYPNAITAKFAKHLPRRVARVLTPFLNVLTSNRQAILLLVLFAPQTAARELFTVIGLQYSSAKFSLSYARGNVLLSIFQGAQGLFVLVLLPLITRTIAEPRGWTAWARDRRYAIASMAVTACGLMTIGIAPVLWVEAAGLLFVALGSCSTGLLMSLLGGAVQPHEVSTVYGLALGASMVTRSVTGPVVSVLLVEGFELGWNWMGLPFATIALLMAGVTFASGFIRSEKVEEDEYQE